MFLSFRALSVVFPLSRFAFLSLLYAPLLLSPLSFSILLSLLLFLLRLLFILFSFVFLFFFSLSPRDPVFPLSLSSSIQVFFILFSE